MKFRTHLVGSTAMAAVLFSGAAWGQAANGAQANAGTPVFGLGELETVVVQAARDNEIAPQSLSTSVITADDMQVFDRKRLDDALSLVPGVATQVSGDSRNEGLIFVRGFNRYEVPLSIDGIQVYLPADNRLDFSRFLTANISEVQVAKGYVSVLNGPGALGGAVNLVTSKPTEDFQVKADASLLADRQPATEGYAYDVLVGGKQDNFYFQAGAGKIDQDYVGLAGGFKPTANQKDDQLNHSASNDYNVNLKAGFTPNETDEYSISFTRQAGSKDAPFNIYPATNPITGTTANIQKDWTWPAWNVNSTYFLSTTNLTDTTILKTRVFYNTFYNVLSSYDSAAFTAQSLGRSFVSTYSDYSDGASGELDQDLGSADTLKAAFHYRRDDHAQWQLDYAPTQTQPKTYDIEDTYSAAAENTLHINDATDFIAGVSYDWRDLVKADDWTRTVVAGKVTSSGFITYPTADVHAVNWQGALVYRLPNDDGTLHASVQDRTRFPTIFEMYSTRFGGATSNPFLKPERDLSTEIGYAANLSGIHVEGAVFYNKLQDAIESVLISAVPFGSTGTIAQSQNVGDGHSAGFELAASAPVSEDVLVGANYAYTDFEVNYDNPLAPISQPPFQITGVPRNQGFVYAHYNFAPQWSFSPSLQFASSRETLSTTSITTPAASIPKTRYFGTGAYEVLNAELEYRITEHFALQVSARNLLDQNYQLTYGFPAPGRSFTFEANVDF